MLNPTQIEQAYQNFMKNLPACAHDGVQSINLNFLYNQGLLNRIAAIEPDTEDLTQYFHVIESTEKVTLFNDHFIVWIIPKMEEQQPMTFVLIALNAPDNPNLEVVFTAHGVYNSPQYVLKVLQHFLADMIETEETLTLFEKEG
jgi:hypothetical protein